MKAPLQRSEEKKALQQRVDFSTKSNYQKLRYSLSIAVEMIVNTKTSRKSEKKTYLLDFITSLEEKLASFS